MAEINVGDELDEKSVAFLEEKLGATINPLLETEKDYYRTVFYFKCCGVQEELKSSHKPAKGIETIEDCFFNKEKMDALFENIYTHALEYERLTNMLESGQMPSDEELMKYAEYSISGQSAYMATRNESLVSQLNDFNHVGNAGNAGLLDTFSIQKISGYLDSFPNLVKDMGDNYHKMCDDAKAELSPLLPENADRTEYFAFIEEHPKAVRALAAVAEATGYSEQWRVSSPKELEMKCQHPAIVAYADKISFNEIGKSLSDLSTQIETDLQQGKLRSVHDVASIAHDGNGGR